MPPGIGKCSFLVVDKIGNFPIILLFSDYLKNFFLKFELKDNCFTEFCGFLSYINKNQPQV